MVPLLLLGVLAVAGGIAAYRGLRMLDEASALRTEMLAIVAEGTEAGLEIDRPTLSALDARLTAASGRFAALEAELAGDPVLGLLRQLPGTAIQVRGGDQVLAAAGQLLRVARDGLTIADRYVQIRDAHANDPGGRSAMAELVELMVNSRDAVQRINTGLTDARRTLESTPAGLLGPIERARVQMLDRVVKYAPLVAAYVEVEDDLPRILGWDAPRRYLVLPQDPAELRPSGGFIGSFGIVAFDKARIVERTFKDVYTLDADRTYPRIEPPPALAGHLVGDGGWMLSDANWSPDFPTAAQDAIRLYANESGDDRIDGVIALNTYAIDELLKLTGPVTVPGYETTVASGETTLTTLQETRLPPAPGVSRKAFLDAFGAEMIDAILELRPRQWPAAIDHLEAIRSARNAMVWLADPAGQALIEQFGWDGAIRDDPGDYVYVVDTNVAPVSKLHYVTTRTTDLDVVLTIGGTARHTLEIIWDNRIKQAEGAVIRDLPTVGHLQTLGMYARVFVPTTSAFESAAGGSIAAITGPEAIAQEAGRTFFSNYLVVPPGDATLIYRWTSWSVSERGEDGTIYRLTMQKQPGLVREDVQIAIAVPDGTQIVEASPELTISGRTATFAAALSRDLELFVRYR